MVIDGKRRALNKRTHCLDCIPFGSGLRKQRYSEEERRRKNIEKKNVWRRNAVASTGQDPARERWRDRKQLVVTHLGGGCLVCGYSRTIKNLTFHHLRDKSFSLTMREFQYSWDRLLPELAKCVLLCHNCHGEVHDNLIELSTQEALMIERLSTFQPEEVAWPDAQVLYDQALATSLSEVASVIGVTTSHLRRHLRKQLGSIAMRRFRIASAKVKP